ncbi:hypothetical protein EDF24_2425 [Curtobacterium sp. PhB130]|uniref:hypothetical protein n=1 Tax=unclassified Curtobacterium TaxID=257496 RepID=UPI000F4B0AC1|nr:MULTISPECIES: hypothetical protein [unclassified Curtobacterium]ROP64686.1 hypothetical protein EDF55_1336 [Curtobacterium sp. ZW137]ROS74986.1 hypothetical protein EDF24_2425 [Curtobacterium sp. PhB130]
MTSIERKPARKYDGPTRKFLKERGWYSPDFVIAFATGANRQAGWWDLDDIILNVVKADGFEPVSILNDSRHIIPAKYLDAIVDEFESRGELKRLGVQDLPTLADL